MDRRAALGAALLTVVFAATGTAAAMYYNVTYFGAARVPLLEPVCLVGAVGYYLLLPPSFDPVAQAWLWVGCFVLASWLLVACWSWFARRLGLRDVGLIVRSLLLGQLPIVAPSLWLAWAMAGPGLPSWSRFVAACLHREFALELPWLAWLYGPLAVAAVGLELWSLARELGWSRAFALVSAGSAAAAGLFWVTATLLP